MTVFKRLDTVRKTKGDYTYEGVVVAVVEKLSGEIRYVIEDERGLLLILNAQQIEKWTP